MKKEKAIEAITIIKRIEELQKSNAFKICNHVLNYNAPFSFGHNYFLVEGKHLPEIEYSRGHTCNTFTLDEKNEIQDEYIRFIERINKILNRKINKLENELSNLKAD